MRALKLAVLVTLLALAPVPSEAGTPMSVRFKRVMHDLHYRLPTFLRGESKSIKKLFGKTLVADPTTRTGLGGRSEHEEMVHMLESRMPEEQLKMLARSTAAPRSLITRFNFDRIPRVIRAQLAHSILELQAMVDEVAATGDLPYARLLAAEQSVAFKRALAFQTYDDEVPDAAGVRKDRRLQVLAPPPASARAVVLRSRQPARINLDEVVDAAAAHGIKPEEIAILDLRFESQRDAIWVRGAGKRPLAGVRVIQMPMLDHTVPTYQQVVDGLRTMVDPKFKLVHIHCKGGRGRTGIMVAAMRIAIDGWDVERAIEEARQSTMWRPLQERFVRNFAAKLKSGELRI